MRPGEGEPISQFCTARPPHPRHPRLVTTGLDPVVHADVQQRETCGLVISKPAARMDCRVEPANDGIKIHSRGAFFVGAADFQILAPRLSVSIEETLASSFRSPEGEKGSGTPVDADPYPPHPAMRLCLRLRKQLACRRSTRGSRQRDFRPQGSASGHASWDAAGAYDPLIALPGEERTPLHGGYPRRACPSPVKHLTRRS